MAHSERPDTPGSDTVSGAIAEVARLVRREYPAARALILTGSAARGEATLLRTPSGIRWLSDLELLAVVANSADLQREVQTLNSLSARIGRSLQQAGVQVSVELTPAPERYFSLIRPHLFGCELLAHGKQLYGAEDYLARIPRFGASQIPKEDGWRLLSNRMVEWLDFMRRSSSMPPDEQLYILAKQYLDLATSLSIFSGDYAASYRERAQQLGSLARWISSEGPELPVDRFVEAVRLATDFKLGGDAARGWFRDPGSADLRSGLEEPAWARLLEDLPMMLVTAWRWEIRALCGRTVSAPADTVGALRRLYGWRQKLRGWATLVLRPHLRSDGALFSRIGRLFPLGTPRTLVYVCAQQLLEQSRRRDPQALAWVKRHLPVIYGECSHDWDALAGQCVRNWQQFLRRGYA